MVSYGMPTNLSFRVEALYPKGRTIGRLRADENGVYRGLPLMVLGEETQQRTFYDPRSMVDQITNPNSHFNMKMRQGKVYGEYGHPSFIGHGYSDADKIQRLMTVDEKEASHVFLGVYSDAPNRDGTVVVRGDLKPTGPYGSVFRESLEDPVINTAFSLRAYVDTKVRPDGLKFRTVKSLVTWDTVGASGYKSTDKAHALGLEAMAGEEFSDFDITILDNGNLMIDQIALESLHDTALNEIFGVNNVSRVVQSRTIVKPDPSLMERFPSLYTKGIFNDFFKEV